MNRSSQSGISLVSTLVLLALLSSIIVTFIYLNRDTIRSATNRVELTKARAAADGAVELAVFGIREKFMDPLTPGGGNRLCRLDDARLSIRVEDEAGKIDLNGASETLLFDLVLYLTEDEVEATSIVDHILDFRDGDDDPRDQGGELRDYELAGLATRPKNRPFQLVDELYQVAGLPVPLVDQLRPNVTVYSRRTGIDPSYAPLPVLMAVSGETRPDTDTAANLSPQEWDRLRSLIPAAKSIQSPRQTFTVIVHTLRDSGFAYSERAVFSLTGQDQSMTLLEKRRISFGTQERNTLNAPASTIGACINLFSDVP